MEKKDFCGPFLLIGLLASANAYAFNYEDFVKLIKDRNITTVADAIASLPQELRSNYDLMSDSRSAQPSSPSHPRAILFGQDAKFIVTFNGDPKHLNHDRLEMIQFRDDTKEFELRAVKFANNIATFSEKNPAACTGCHNASPRPIWGSYEDWPGSYGSNDRISREHAAKDYQDLQSFFAIQPTHDRYRSLIRDPQHSMYPFLNLDDAITGGSSHYLRPGNRMGQLLGRLMARRAAEVIRGSSYFRAHPATALLGLISLGKDTLSRPPCFQEKGGMEEYDAAIRRDLETIYSTTQFPRIYKNLAGITNSEDARDFILQKLLLGPDLYTWDINHFAGSGVIGGGGPYTTGIINMTGLVSARVLDFAVEMIPELRPYYKPSGVQAVWGERYIKMAVAPYDIAYDGAGLFYDVAAARASCELLFGKARAEWTLGFKD